MFKRIEATRGRLSYFWQEWEKMGASRRVVRLLKFGLPLCFNRLVVETTGLPGLIAHYQDLAKRRALTIMIDQVLEKKCIRRMSETECGFFSRVFLVPKRSGGWSLVIALSVLNSSLAQVTFEMDMLAKVKQVAHQGM